MTFTILEKTDHCGEVYSRLTGEMWHFDETGRGSDAGWIQVGSRKYYCFGQGRLATGTVCIDGSNFEFETTGVMK